MKNWIEKIPYVLLITGLSMIGFSLHQKYSYKPKKKAMVVVSENFDVDNLVFIPEYIPLMTSYSLSVKPIRKIKIAVVDTGIDFSHPMLKNFQSPRIKDSYNSTYGLPHGTHVAGILAKELTKVYGRMAYDLFEIESFRFEPNDGLSYSKALIDAVNSNPDVINLSLSGEGLDPFELNVLAYAAQQGVLMVAAAGNEGSDLPSFPCAYSFLICVENMNGKTINPSSNRGDFILAQAQGTQILSSIPENKFGYMTGTSQAAPVVTAQVASAFVNPLADKEFDVFYKPNYKPIMKVSFSRKPAGK